MKRENKYIYYWVIWSNYGYGWEAESIYDKKETTFSEVKRDMLEYHKACPNASYHIKERRELNPEYKGD